MDDGQGNNHEPKRQFFVFNRVLSLGYIVLMNALLIGTFFFIVIGKLVVLMRRRIVSKRTQEATKQGL